ncbi:helix-turn-helix domain-containing protein [Lactococcus petauri]|uniref:helix-turn-helix domain-containing protein n=1 Tax=Lactococcus petauri TaxID=1940789 RepID=UPI00157014F7|nr:helix-turn-helix transcriptional regulator [Lactococcus petauri]NSL25467.1 helix-turn-helix transcriptional regulator [Lactococcus petauri]
MFYERLQLLAKKNKKSLNQIEKELELPKNTLYNYKKNSPTTDRLNALAKYFNVSTDYLLGREEEKIDNNLTAEENEVIAAFRLDNNNMSLEEQAEYDEAIKEMMAIAKRLLNDDSKWKK